MFLENNSLAAGFRPSPDLVAMMETVKRISVFRPSPDLVAMAETVKRISVFRLPPDLIALAEMASRISSGPTLKAMAGLAEQFRIQDVPSRTDMRARVTDLITTVAHGLRMDR